MAGVKVVAGGAWQTIADIKVVAAAAWQRVQTAKQVVAGAWQTVFVYDIVGPVAPTGVAAKWNNAGGNACVVSWTASVDADLAFTDIYVNRASSSGGPWTYLGRNYGGPSSAQSYTDTSVTLTTSGLNQVGPIHYYLLIPYDVRGNQGTSIVVGSTGQGNSVVRGMYATPAYVGPSDGGTWKEGANSWTFLTAANDGTDYSRPAQGNPGGGNCWGFQWYENKIPGLNATNFEVFTWRVNGPGLGSAQTPGIYLCQAPASSRMATNPTGFATSGPTPATGIAYNGTASDSAWQFLYSAWEFHLMDGATWHSILYFVANGSNYMVLKSMRESAFGIVGGCLRITHTG